MAYEWQRAAGFAPVHTENDSDWNNDDTVTFNSSAYLTSVNSDHNNVVGGKSAFTVYVAIDDNRNSASWLFFFSAKGAGTEDCGFGSYRTGAGPYVCRPWVRFIDSLNNSIYHYAPTVSYSATPVRLYMCIRSDGTKLETCINSTSNQTSNANIYSTLTGTIVLTGATLGKLQGGSGQWLGKLGGIWFHTQYHTDRQVDWFLKHLIGRFSNGVTP